MVLFDHMSQNELVGYLTDAWTLSKRIRNSIIYVNKLRKDQFGSDIISLRYRLSVSAGIPYSEECIVFDIKALPDYFNEKIFLSPLKDFMFAIYEDDDGVHLASSEYSITGEHISTYIKEISMILS